MKNVALFPFLIFISGCATFEVAGEIQSGRIALMNGESQVALTHFQRAAQSDPQYTASNPLQQGVWTYVGRAYYAMGNMPEARRAFEQAVSRSSQDLMAKLYLGLTAIHQQKEQTSVKPFSLDDVLYALREGVSPERVAALVKQRGVSFEPTGAAESALKKVGANDQLIREIKLVGAQPKGNVASGGSSEKAVKEVETAMKELYDWLESIPHKTQYGRFWDPGREIRSQIEVNLRLISAGQVERDKLAAGGEWIGLKLEQEVDRARRDELEYDRRMQQMR